MEFEYYKKFRELLPSDLDERAVARTLGGTAIRGWIASNFGTTGKCTEAELADFFYKVAELTGETKDTISDTAYTSLVANWKRAAPSTGSARLAVASYYTLHRIPFGNSLAEKVDRAVFDGKTFEDATGQPVPAPETQRLQAFWAPKKLVATGVGALSWFWKATIALLLAVVAALIADQLLPYLPQNSADDAPSSETILAAAEEETRPASGEGQDEAETAERAISTDPRVSLGPPALELVDPSFDRELGVSEQDPDEVPASQQREAALENANEDNTEVVEADLAPAPRLTVRVYGNEIEYRSIQDSLRNLPIAVVRQARRSDCHEGTPVTSIWPDRSVDFAEFISVMLQLESHGITFYQAYPKNFPANQTIDVGSSPNEETCTVDMSGEPFTRDEIASARYFCWQHRPSLMPPIGWSSERVARWCFSR
jgi:hypothetical protein